MPLSSAPKYRAFLSYSHADTSWAKWLHGRLEAFEIEKDLAGRETAMGPVPKSLRPIFRDRDDFSGGHTLTDATLVALDASAALIVLCSPISAISQYVNEEVRLFRSRHPGRPVIPVVIEGTAPANFPSALRFEMNPDGTLSDRPVMFLGPDVRDTADGKRLALAKIISGITGVATDDIVRRAARAERAATWRRRRAYAIVAALLGAVGVAWWQEQWFREQYQWHMVMGPAELTEEQEKALAAQPKAEFKECRNGCPTMVIVPPGTFMMSSPENEKDRKPLEDAQHQVTITKPFAVGKTEVTFAEWDVCVSAGACPMTSDSTWGRHNRPVINVSRTDAQQYVSWLSRITGRDYKLLTEAEWEYAARAGSASRFTFGEDEALLVEYAWYKKNSPGGTQPVAQRKPNAFGLHDMHGNVWEWVEECWDGLKIGDCMRGGAWVDDPEGLRSARSFRVSAGGRSYALGFRVGRSLRP